MKATTIIISAFSLLFVLATTIVADDNGFNGTRVLDYKTGKPILWKDSFVMRAIWKGQRYYVDTMDLSYIGLRLKPRPSRFVSFMPITDPRGAMIPELTVTTSYIGKFDNVSDSFWALRSSDNRIQASESFPLDSEQFVIARTRNSRVYKLLYPASNPGTGSKGSYVIGVKMIKHNKEERYYLAAMTTSRDHGLRFTFETS